MSDAFYLSSSDGTTTDTKASQYRASSNYCRRAYLHGPSDLDGTQAKLGFGSAFTLWSKTVQNSLSFGLTIHTVIK
jgi:hypothetical protein